jgi:hypothetical protein
MARVFVEGFEAGSLDGFDSNYGASIVSAPTGMDGNYAVDLGLYDYLVKYLTASPEYYFSLMYRPAGSTSEAVFSVCSGSNLLVKIIRGSSPHPIKVYIGSTLIATGTALLAEDTAYLIEAYIKISDSNGRIIVKVNGITDIDFYGDTQAGTYTQIDVLRIGEIPGYTCNAYYDNIIVDNSYWPGESKIRAIVPSGVGTYTQWTPSSSPNWSSVDEIPPDDIDFVEANAIDYIDTYIFADMPFDAKVIKSVQLQARAQKEGTPTPQHLQLVTLIDGIGHTSEVQEVQTAWHSNRKIWEINPSTGNPWTVNELNSAEFGIKAVA